MASNGQQHATVPAFDALMWPTLRALKAMGGSAANEELLAKVVEIELVPDAVASLMHGDNRQTKLGYNLAWAKTYLKRVGAIGNSGRGVWAITEVGEQLSAADVAKIPQIVRRQDYERRREQDGDGEPTAEEAVAAERPPPEETWKDRLLTALKAMAPDAFERLSQRLLREAGFVKVEVTGKSGDGGIDGIGVLRINLVSFQVLFQCKRHQGSVGSGTVRDFRGAVAIRD